MTGGSASGGTVGDPRRRVPRTDVLLADPRLVEAVARLGTGLVKRAVQQAQDLARRGELAPEQVADAAVAALPEAASSSRPVINATGIVVHTNLGRAPLSAAAHAALLDAAGTTDLELDLSTGRRGRRGRGALAALEHRIPDAEAVHVVNNNAAALVLAATALAAGREIIVSRGELVEIGAGFRLPELLTSTGARLVEVGTTNRVTVRDYALAFTPATALVLKVHPSNFVVSGFTGSATVAELALLGVPVVVDVGSGLLSAEALLPDEPDVSTALRQGASLVTASADKLLGGPQAGLIAGRRDLVERLRHHPLARALRVDKLTLAALEATLTGPEPPVSVLLRTGTDELRRRAIRLAELVGGVAVPSEGAVGGGGAPGVRLPGWGVALPEELAEALRRGARPVLGRVAQNRCLLDLRSVLPEQDDELVSAVQAAVAGAR